MKSFIKKAFNLLAHTIVIILLLCIGIAITSTCDYKIDISTAKNYYNKKDYSKSVSLYLNLIDRSPSPCDSNLYISCADAYIAAKDYQSAYKLLKGAKDVSNTRLISNKLKEVPSTRSEPLKTTSDYKNSNITFVFFFSYIVIVIIVELIISKQKKNKKLTTLVTAETIETAPYISNYNPRNIKSNTPPTPTFIYDNSGLDCFFADAIHLVVKAKQASTGILQRELKIGYARAARIIDQLEEYGVIGPFEGSKPREVLIDDTTAEIITQNLHSSQNKPTVPNSIYNRIYHLDLINEDFYSLDSIMQRIDSMSENGWEFERFVADLLIKNGFKTAEVTTGSNDYGVDIIATNNYNVRYAIQCKCYSNKVNNKSVQEVMAGQRMYNCQVGVVVTNNYFTQNAIDLAKANSILLWDREFIKKSISETTL